eukprot:GFUD01028824.1.p1 GENE.GFUD01028824.1~~GFUD01028824.1.p1  ORF type:complete len:560 (+),score=164.45 GFUD01028824.1:83-1762(+)
MRETGKESFVVWVMVAIVASLNVMGLQAAKITNNASAFAEFIEFDGDSDHDSDNMLYSEHFKTSSGRLRDSVGEEMVKTAWLDYITRLNREKKLYGLEIEPLQLSHVLDDELYISQTMLGYQVELWMWNLTLHGLSGLSLQKLSLERNAGLTDIFTSALLDVDQLSLTGMYRMQGTSAGALSWVLSDISSEGDRPLSINLTNVRVAAELEVALVTGCGQEGAVVTELKFPFSYREIDFKFENIGTVLATAVDIIGGLVIERERTNLVKLLKEGIASEVKSLICADFLKLNAEAEHVDTNVISPIYYDTFFKGILEKEGGSDLIRDRLAENTVKKIFHESIRRHLDTSLSPLRTALDPLKLFPLEFKFKNDLYSANVEACDAYVHNVKQAVLEDMYLARDTSLNTSILRVQFKVPVTWMSGFYKLRKAYLFTFIPAGGSGDFNVDLRDVKVSLTVVLKNTQQGLVMEHFKVDIGWQTISFKFDGLWKGFGEIADKVMNQLGVGGLIVEKQKRWIMGEIKTYLRGLAVCMMWSPSLGLDLCMRQFWIDLGWDYPWVYPDCD